MSVSKISERETNKLKCGHSSRGKYISSGAARGINAAEYKEKYVISNHQERPYRSDRWLNILFFVSLCHKKNNSRLETENELDKERE